MARRMFSDEITSSDAFLDMPSDSQLLYFQLGMNADDDGFIANTKMIQRMVNASDDSLKLLFAKKFLLAFENGVCVVKHWRINNFIRKDIYRETKYQREKAQLFIRENGTYTRNPDNAKKIPRGHFTVEALSKNPLLPTPKQHVNEPLTPRYDSGYVGKVRIGKVSKGKDTNTASKKFKKPTLKEVEEYCKERNNIVDPQRFIDHYDSNGWKVGGKSAMKDWKASVRTWERNKFNQPQGKQLGNVLAPKDNNKSLETLQNRVRKA